jgi:hypothetical protein
MKLDELAKRIRIKVGVIIKSDYAERRMCYARVVQIEGNQIGGWWVFRKEDCNSVGNNTMGYFKDIDKVELVE